MFALLQDGFNHRGQALALVVLNAAFVGELGQGGVNGHTGQERQVVGIGGGLGPALAEEGDLPAAVGTEEVAHILHQTNDGDVHHLRHLDRFFDHHAYQLLRRGHDDDAVQRDGLEDVQGYVAGAGRHIHKEIVYVPDDVGPELGDYAADHRAAPDHGIGLVIQQEIDADELDAGLRFDREHPALIGHGPAVDAEGLGDGGAGDVGV